MENKLRVLFVEDSQNDVELILHRLKLAGYVVDYDRVEAAAEMKVQLQEYSWNMILADYKMPQFDATGALSLYHEMALDIPFIILSNAISDETAVALMNAGAHDYLIKDNLARLIPVVVRELNEAKIRKENRLALQSLNQSKARLIRGESVSKTGNWELHLDTGTIYSSEGAQKIYGVVSEHWSYDIIKTIPLPEYRAKLDSAVFKLVEQNIPYDLEFKIRHQLTGEIIDIHSIAEYDRESRVVFGVIQDITDRKGAEERLKVALAKAEESDRLKLAFLATMNHELRTPLNHIIGFSELIQSGVMPEDNQSFASNINTSGKNLLAIVEDIFDLALAEQANVKLRIHTFRLMDQFMENKSFFDQILQYSGKTEQIQLIYKPDPKLLSMYLTVDRSKVNQILINLFKNAVKFTNEGSIEFGYQSNEPGKLTYFIKDTGIGIAKEKQAVIFDYFRQGDDSPTRAYGGIGIGLAIALRISRILNGDLSVESEPEKGSTFCLTIAV